MKNYDLDEFESIVEMDTSIREHCYDQLQRDRELYLFAKERKIVVCDKLILVTRTG